MWPYTDSVVYVTGLIVTVPIAVLCSGTYLIFNRGREARVNAAVMLVAIPLAAMVMVAVTGIIGVYVLGPISSDP